MNFGMADLWADVGTKSILDHYANGEYWNKPTFMGGLFLRYCAHPALSFRLGTNYGTLYATDKWNKDKAQKAESIEEDAYQRYVRNLHVRTNIWEFSLLAEFSPLRANYETSIARRRFQPYLLLGVAGFHFNPQAKYVDPAGNDRGYVNLYDLHIEGDGASPEFYKDAPKKYELWQLAIPAGIGVKWDIGRRLALGVQYIYRVTFTDYLDNVSGKYVHPAVYADPKLGLAPHEQALAAEMQDRSFLLPEGIRHQPGELRGNPSDKDSYSTIGISIFFKVPNRKDPWWF